MPASPYPAEWLRGTLELCVLGVIAEQTTYGYEITQRLEDAGLGAVKGGTLYPLLARLESQEFIHPSWRAGEGGPSRKYLQITEAGREELRLRRAQWRQFSSSVDSLAHLSGGSRQEGR